jgi:hypothetical protein
MPFLRERAAGETSVSNGTMTPRAIAAMRSSARSFFTR